MEDAPNSEGQREKPKGPPTCTSFSKFSSSIEDLFSGFSGGAFSIEGLPRSLLHPKFKAQSSLKYSFNVAKLLGSSSSSSSSSSDPEASPLINAFQDDQETEKVLKLPTPVEWRSGVRVGKVNFEFTNNQSSVEVNHTFSPPSSSSVAKPFSDQTDVPTKSSNIVTELNESEPSETAGERVIKERNGNEKPEPTWQRRKPFVSEPASWSINSSSKLVLHKDRSKHKLTVKSRLRLPSSLYLQLDFNHFLLPQTSKSNRRRPRKNFEKARKSPRSVSSSSSSSSSASMRLPLNESSSDLQAPEELFSPRKDVPEDSLSPSRSSSSSSSFVSGPPSPSRKVYSDNQTEFKVSAGHSNALWNAASVLTISVTSVDCKAVTIETPSLNVNLSFKPVSLTKEAIKFMQQNEDTKSEEEPDRKEIEASSSSSSFGSFLGSSSFALGFSFDWKSFTTEVSSFKIGSTWNVPSVGVFSLTRDSSGKWTSTAFRQFSDKKFQVGGKLEIPSGSFLASSSSSFSSLSASSQPIVATGCIGYFPCASTQFKGKICSSQGKCDSIAFSLLMLKLIPQMRLKIASEWLTKDSSPKVGINLKFL